MLKNEFADLRLALKDCAESVENIDGKVVIKFKQEVKNNINSILQSLAQFDFSYDIKLNYCDLGDDLAQQLLNGIQKIGIRVECLSLDGNSISDKSVDHIIRLIENTNIEYLSIEGDNSFVRRPSISIKGIKKIMNSLKKNTNLTFLNLIRNDGHDPDIDSDIWVYMDRNQYRKLSILADKKIEILSNENESLQVKLAIAHEKIEKLDITHKELFAENDKLKSKLNYLAKDKETAAIKIQSFARGLFARKQLKNERIKREHAIENHIQQKKQEIQLANTQDDFDTVAQLSKPLKQVSDLFRQGKLHAANQKIRGKEEIEFQPRLGSSNKIKY